MGGREKRERELLTAVALHGFIGAIVTVESSVTLPAVQDTLTIVTHKLVIVAAVSSC